MLDGLVRIDPARGPLPEQISHAVAQAVRAGRLKPGAHLPGSRQLATRLGISRNSVNAAYELLRAQGIIAIRHGAAPRVAIESAFEAVESEGQAERVSLSRRGELLSLDLRGPAGLGGTGQLEPGAPDEDLFPAVLWARALRRAARRRFGKASAYADMQGLPHLRAVLADHLSRQRGVAATAGQIIVLPSTQAALTLVAQCLADPGEVAWVESPGYFGARTAFAAAGLDVRGIAVDEHGADPSKIACGPPPRLIYVTPSHQFPTGARMTLQRRLELLESARRVGAVIVEDDYDSEFLWQGRAIAALQGISRGEEVVYLGTTAKSLLPGLRLAYMVVPPSLAEPVTQAQRNLGLRANIHAQAAFADLIESGIFVTHLRRLGKLYAARGSMLVQGVRSRVGGRADIAMPMGGLQTVIRFASRVDDAVIAGSLVEEGFETPALSRYCVGAPQAGLVVGFADATEKRVTRFADCLARALD